MTKEKIIKDYTKIVNIIKKNRCMVFIPGLNYFVNEKGALITMGIAIAAVIFYYIISLIGYIMYWWNLKRTKQNKEKNLNKDN